MWIYLFGEIHFDKNIKPEKGMMAIDEFSVKVVQDSKNIPIDLFLETSLKLGEIKSYFITQEKQLYRIHDTFRECIGVNKVNCPYSNIRVHNVDPRRYGLSGELIVFSGFVNKLLPQMNNSIVLSSYSYFQKIHRNT